MFRLQGIPVLLLHTQYICCYCKVYLCYEVCKTNFCTTALFLERLSRPEFYICFPIATFKSSFSHCRNKRKQIPGLWTFDRLKTCLRKTNLAENNLRTDCVKRFLENSPIPVLKPLPYHNLRFLCRFVL